MSSSRPIRVAVIGGGCAAMAAAFELTRPELRRQYQLTVYQLGWRLGGKGASGRGPADRIEEHGLHLWMGFYENAFRLMRETYAELDRDPKKCPISSWREAFAPAPLVGVTERTAGGEWSIWKGILPPTEGLPGDPLPVGHRWTVADYMARSVALVGTLFRTFQLNRDGVSVASEAAATGRGAPPSSFVLDGIARLLRYGELATMAGLIQAVAFLEVMIGSLSQYPENLVLRLLDGVASNARSVLAMQLESEPELQRVWNVIDLTLATVRGGIRSGLLTDPRGFDAIDEYDSREWLRLHGASEGALNSGWIRALYDFGFSYENGDATRPRISAGQALRSMLRAFFTYRGSFFWRMQAGMGDIVFSPLYEVLKRRGVRFEFFHRLENVKLAAPGRLRPGEAPYVEALQFDVQAETKRGEYRPLADIRGLPCWPAAPDFSQLVDGARLAREGWDFESHWERRQVGSKTLRVGKDFDLVILGIGLGAVPYVCKEIVARDARWRTMIDHVQTVATQALQIWMHADMGELGRPGDPMTVSGFVEPFDTWADMQHLIAQESWRRQPRALAYFCSVLPDIGDLDPIRVRQYPAKQIEHVRRNAIRFLNRDLGRLWPRAVGPTGEFRWDLLADPDESARPRRPLAGEARLGSQYWRANVNPTDRYALSLPGSSAHRISPLDETYDNLTVCGDWTDCGFNAGCVEAAVMSGRLAAHAISKSPPLEDVVGFDHP